MSTAYYKFKWPITKIDLQLTGNASVLLEIYKDTHLFGKITVEDSEELHIFLDIF